MTLRDTLIVVTGGKNQVITQSLLCDSVCNEKYVCIYVYIHEFWNVYIYSRKSLEHDTVYHNVNEGYIFEFQDYMRLLKIWLPLFSDVLTVSKD